MNRAGAARGTVSALRAIRGALLVAVLLTAAIVAGGCGSGSSTTTTNQQSVLAWANNLCGAVVTYVQSIKAAGGSVKGNPTSAGLKDATSQASTATDEFANTVKDLGKPNTSSGQQAKDAVDTLADQISADMKKIQAATAAVDGASGLVAALSVVSGTLVTAKDQISTTVEQLQSLEGGQLKQAFANADSCSSLQS